MVEAFGKIKKIHTKIQENMKGKDMTEEQRGNELLYAYTKHSLGYF